MADNFAVRLAQAKSATNFKHFHNAYWFYRITGSMAT